MDHTKVEVTGEITAKAYRQTDPILNKWNRFVEYLMLVFPSVKQSLFKLYAKGELVWADEQKNVICKAGFARVTGALANDLTLTYINKMLLGTGVGSATANDTQLITETYRNDTASGTHADNICYLTAFFTQTEVTGTFKEFGNVIGGTGSANTGYLWSHLAGLNWVKDNVTTLTIDCKYTFQSV